MLTFTDDVLAVEAADEYHESRGNAAWIDAGSSPPDDKAAAIRRGTDYIAGKYNSRWAVEFDVGDVPVPVLYAIAEAARLELASAGSLTPTVDTSSGRIKRTREKVGPIEEESEYFDSGAVATTVSVIEQILRGAGLIRSGVQRLMRA